MAPARPRRVCEVRADGVGRGRTYTPIGLRRQRGSGRRAAWASGAEVSQSVTSCDGCDCPGLSRVHALCHLTPYSSHQMQPPHPQHTRALVTSRSAAGTCTARAERGGRWGQHKPVEFSRRTEPSHAHSLVSPPAAAEARHLFPPIRRRPDPCEASGRGARWPIADVPCAPRSSDPGAVHGASYSTIK